MTCCRRRARTTARDATSFTDLGKDMWSNLTGNEATIDYTFVDMTVEVPRSTGPDSERATWSSTGRCASPPRTRTIAARSTVRVPDPLGFQRRLSIESGLRVEVDDGAGSRPRSCAVVSRPDSCWKIKPP